MAYLPDELFEASVLFFSAVFYRKPRSSMFVAELLIFYLLTVTILHQSFKIGKERQTAQNIVPFVLVFCSSQAV